MSWRWGWTEKAVQAAVKGKITKNPGDSGYKEAVAEELLNNWNTYKTQYKASLVSNVHYNRWVPWYIKTNTDYDEYVRLGLEFESTKDPLTNTYYFRYMAARYKETDPFYIGTTLVDQKNWLWALGSEQPGLEIEKTNQMFGHLKLKLNASLVEQTTAATGKYPDNTDANISEYHGGYTQRKAYEFKKKDYINIPTNDKNVISRDIMQNKQDIFLDIATRYPQYYLDVLSKQNKHDSYFRVKKLFSKEWLTEFSDSNLEAHFAYRDNFLDNKDTIRDKVNVYPDNTIIQIAKSLALGDKQRLYKRTKLMNANDESTTKKRETNFLNWAKNTSNKYSPILINHYFNNDSLSEENFHNWTPYWLHSKSDYDKIFENDEDNIKVPLATGETKLSKLAETKHIALIKFFTIEQAQRQLNGYVPENKIDQSKASGQKFWNTLWWSQQQQNESHRLFLDGINLWKSLYNPQYFDDINSKRSVENILYDQWQDELIAFEYFAYIIKKMELNNHIDFDFIVFDANKFRLSEEIIDYDKTLPAQPFTDFANFKTNKRDDIWTNLFIYDKNNYQSDYDAWVDDKIKKPETLDLAFQKWSKIVSNGEKVFMAHNDAKTALQNWDMPTLKVEAEYDVITPSWDNLKSLWAKETYSTWSTSSGHFYNWFNSKQWKPGQFLPRFVLEYLNNPVAKARISLDIHPANSLWVMGQYITRDFNNKASWLIKLYIWETTTAPADFNHWLSTYRVPAKRDIIDVINNNYADIKSEVETIYKNSVVDHLAGYKSWRDAISAANQRTEYDRTAESDTKYDEYVKSV